MYLNHLCRLIVTLWSFFNDQVSDSPQEKCQQKRIWSFEVASSQRIDCQKDDLLLNSLLCNDSPSSVSKTSLCESVSIVCHDNMPLNYHSAVPKQRNHCKTSSGVESKSIHYSIHPSGSVLNPIIAENVKDKSVKYWLKDLGLDDYCLITDGEWLTDRHIDIFNNLLIKTFPKQNGLQSSIILSHYQNYNSSSHDFVQIVNVSNSHWICVSNILSPVGVVEVYDSLPSISRKSWCVPKQVAKILKTKEDAFELRNVDVQRQIRGNDCSLFAMAFAVALCLGQDPHIISYAQEKMRFCICESKHVLPFLQADRPKRHTKRILCGIK